MERAILADYIIGFMPMLKRKLFRFRLHTTNFTGQQIGFLHILTIDNGYPINFYSDKMAISKPNMTKLMTSLLKDELIERHHDTKDRRVVNVYITEKGKKTLNYHYNNIKNDIIGSLQSIPDEDVKKLNESFLTIKTIFEKVDNTPKKED